MGTLEIVIGAVLLLISLVTIIICMMQEQKPQNATAALTGASNDSFYDKNRVIGQLSVAALLRTSLQML